MAQIKKRSSPFDSFTNLYSLSKTLRFELKPIGKTRDLLEENKVFEKDEKIAESYKEAKKYFNTLHREFIDKALNEINLPIYLYKDFNDKFFLWKEDKNKSNTTGLEKSAKKIRTVILENFYIKAEEYRDEYSRRIEDEKKRKKLQELKGLDLFFKVEIFDFLKQKYPEAQNENVSIFDPFNKFGGYFKKFHETRKNFYKDDGTSTAIPTRIINVNLAKFLENKRIFETEYSGKHESFFSEGEKEIFKMGYFNNCFTQKQIESYNDIIASLKSKINRFRQENPDIDKKELPFFKILFKQILGQKSKHETEQDIFIEILSDEEVFPALQKFIDENKVYIPKAKVLFDRFTASQLNSSNDFDIEGIHVANRFINQISNKWFSNWNTIRNLLYDELKLKKNQKKFPDFISINKLKIVLQKAQNEIDAKDLFRDGYKDIFESETDFYQIFVRIWEREFNENVKGYYTETENVEKLISEDKQYLPNKKGKLKNGQEGIIHNENILDYAQSVLNIYQMIKYFSLEKGKDREWNPEGLYEDNIGGFYDEFNKYYENVNTWKYFNEFRNYLTKKPYSEGKIKLNFECSSLLGGWSRTYESNGAFIFEKKGKYYLGIIKGTKFNDEEVSLFYKDINENNLCKRMIYDFQKPDFKNFPRLFIRSNGDNFAPAVKKYHLPIHSILDIYDKGLYKTENKNNPNRQDSLNKMIDYFKLGIKHHDSYKHFDFKWQESNNYFNISEFYNDVTRSCYRISWEDINFNELQKLINKGRIYLFQIYNKDFELDGNIAPEGYSYKGKEGSKNLHTKYWQEMFGGKNLEKTVIKLNGEAEIFVRRGSLKPEVDIERKTKRNITKYKRYTENKILFHCPITLNFAENENGINTKVLKMLKNNHDINIIGIDRGEKHLAYFSVVDQKGNILKTGSFNKIKERKDREPTDYQQKLDKIEKDRDWQRKSWQEISNIKDMKKGYISQVVHQICKLIVDYNAIVVFEDLNIGFKRGRFAIEKQVYQNLELALAKKLNYLVFKDAKDGEAGHHLKAYQLTPIVANFQDINKQCGIMFYIPASYTSAVCPVCGFRKNIPIPVEKLDKNKDLLRKFYISYEEDRDRFCFRYKRSDFYRSGDEKKKSNELKLFEKIELPDDITFYSDVERLKYKRNKDNRGGEVEDRNPNRELKELFKKHEINILANSKISEQINSKEFVNENFYIPLISKIALILQLRNSKTVKNEDGTVNEQKSRDFISCPNCYFHSEKNLLNFPERYKGNEKFEFNGDANGAYNIARKGSLIIQKINKIHGLEKIDYQSLTVTQEDWDKFVSQNSSLSPKSSK